MFFKKKKKKIIGISGMSCDACALRIDKALEELADVDSAKVELKKGEAIVYYEDDVDSLLLQKTVEDLGYVVTGIKEVR